MEKSSEYKSISQITPSFLKLENSFEKGTEKITNHRQLIIKDFTDALNSERKGTKYKQLTPRGVAVLVGHLSEFDLKYFFKQCYNSNSFLKMFFGCLRNK